MATTKVRTIKIDELAKAVDAAVSAAGKARLPGGLIMGRTCTPAQAAKLDVDGLAKSITKDLSAALPGYKLTPKVIIGKDLITMGFIARPPIG